MKVNNSHSLLVVLSLFITQRRLEIKQCHIFIFLFAFSSLSISFFLFCFLSFFLPFILPSFFFIILFPFSFFFISLFLSFSFFPIFTILFLFLLSFFQNSLLRLLKFFQISFTVVSFPFIRWLSFIFLFFSLSFSLFPFVHSIFSFTLFSFSQNSSSFNTFFNQEKSFLSFDSFPVFFYFELLLFYNSDRSTNCKQDNHAYKRMALCTLVIFKLDSCFSFRVVCGRSI